MPMTLYKYDIDIPDYCWAVDIDNETLYLTASRRLDTKLVVEVNHGYAPGSAPFKRERELFEENEAEILKAAEKAIPVTDEMRRAYSLTGIKLCSASRFKKGMKPLTIKSLDGELLATVPAPVGGWTTVALENAVDALSIRESVHKVGAADAFLGEEWLGSTEV